MYPRKSIAKPVVGAGTAKPRKGKITVIYADDVLSFPERDGNKVKMIGNISLIQGAKMYNLYMTPNSQKLSDEITGDPDFESFDKKCEGIHPGNSIDIREFRANNLGVGLILIFDENCGESSGDVFGSPCNPFKLKGSYTNDSEGIKNVMMFAPDIMDSSAIGRYSGAKLLLANFTATGVALALTIANGFVQQLPSLDTTAAITADSIDLVHGTIISLIGGGGADPATLDDSTQGEVDVILKDGTQWVALKNAIINLKVIDGGSTTYLIEESRA